MKLNTIHTLGKALLVGSFLTFATLSLQGCNDQAKEVKTDRAVKSSTTCKTAKCKSGKCGDAKKAPAMKCKTGKCGNAKKAPVMKCEAGKCATGKCGQGK